MVMQIEVRKDCLECERDNPDCPKCKGTGWVKFWVDLKIIARAIKRGEPIEPMVNLSRLGT